MTPASPVKTPDIEEDRIRGAYARRSASDCYSHFHPGHLLMVQQRERLMLRLLRRVGVSNLEQVRTLEVGCGSGNWLREFVRWGAQPDNLVGIDLLPDRIAEARRRCPPGVDLRCASAARLDFPAASFDLVLQSTVFTSILDADMRRQVAAEMIRVLRPEGIILWYDFRVDNPRNRDVRGVGGREIRALFSGCRVSLEPLTLAPPLARWLAPRSWLASSLLECIPWLCTHYLGTIRKVAP